VSDNTSATGGYLAPESSVIDGDALHDVMQAAVVGITGIDGSLVRPRWQPNPPTQPSKNTDWCAFGIERQTKYDFPVIQHQGAEDGRLGRDVLSRGESLSVLTSFYGPNAYSLAQRWRDGLYISQNLEQLGARDIKLYETGEIISLPALTNSDFVLRVDLEVTFMRTVTVAYPIRNIVSAEVQLQTSSGGEQPAVPEADGSISDVQVDIIPT
jgi:hypothetical protein